MPESDLPGRRVVGFADQRRDGGADLDADWIAVRREDARVGGAVRRDLSRLVLVAVQAVDTDRVERLEIPLPHARERQPVEPRIVGDEADHTPASRLRDPPLRHPEKADVEVVQPLALWRSDALRRAIGVGQCPFLVHRHAREAVVGRVAEDHEYRPLLLHALRAVAFLLKFREGQRLVGAGLPTGQRVREIDAGALRSVVGQRRVEVLHGDADLKMSDDGRAPA